MQQVPFKASVQYGDWTGTSAADGADKADARAWLKQNGIAPEGEFLVGMTMYAGESHGAHKDPVYVEFLFASAGDHDNVKAMIEASEGPILVRRLKREMPVTEFLGLFKRFSISFSAHGMLEGREYTFIDF